MKVLFSALTVAGLLVFAADGAAAIEEVSGRAKIVSGDEMIIEGHKIRLYGVDAPDIGQPCEDEYGVPVACDRRAREALHIIIGKRNVTCVDFIGEENGVLVGYCYAGDVLLNSRIVREGWALAYRPVTKDFLVEEGLARREDKGIWPLRFQQPWIWRKNNPPKK